MKTTNAMIAEAVLAELRTGRTMSDVAAGLSAYLVTERRSKDADAIVREVEQRLLKEENQLELTMTTARPLSEGLRKELITQFGATGKKVTTNEIIDPSVVGGVLVESSDKRLDLTVRRQLQRLKGMGV